jgi:hypothetical protein
MPPTTTIVDATETESICPACQRPTPPHILEQWSGCCPHCKRSFLLAHGNARAVVKRLESERTSHTGGVSVWDGEVHSAEPTEAVPFDMQAVERELGELQDTETEDTMASAAVVLARMFAFIWTDPKDYHAALCKFVGLSCALRPDLLGGLTLKQLGGHIGCSKQNLSKIIGHAEKVLNLKFSRTRSASSKRSMSSAMRDSHARREAAAA